MMLMQLMVWCAFGAGDFFQSELLDFWFTHFRCSDFESRANIFILICRLSCPAALALDAPLIP